MQRISVIRFIPIVRSAHDHVAVPLGSSPFIDDWPALFDSFQSQICLVHVVPASGLSTQREHDDRRVILEKWYMFSTRSV